MTLYMITVSCSQKKDYINKICLDEVIQWLYQSIEIFSIAECVYENSGKYHQLHYHGIVTVDRDFRYKPFTKFGDKDITGNTYQVHWSRIRCLPAVKRYLIKDLRYKTQDEIFIDNYYSINRFSERYES